MNPLHAREVLHHLLGGIPPEQFTIEHRTPIGRTGIRAEEIILQNRSGGKIRAFLTGPAGEWRNLPAILYIHAHGNRYGIGAEELLSGRAALLTPAYGEALAHQNMLALSIDLPCFGSRMQQTESALAKSYLWHGHVLFGAMLTDLTGVLDMMTAMPEINPARIGAFGISMGATLAFWLGALDPRISAAAHLCCFADLATLVETGAHDLHGHYMTVPGLLAAFRTGEIAGLMAPRPQLACMGLTDPLTPEKAVSRAVDDLRMAYGAAGAQQALSILISPDTGHVETPAMRAAVLGFFQANLTAP